MCFKNIIFSISLATACLCSCMKDNIYLYSDTSIGNIVDGKFITDEGNIYNIVQQNYPGNLFESKRAMVLSDILKKTGENTYDIKLIEFADVLVKDVVKQSSLVNQDELGHNAADIVRGWGSGGYLNLLISFTHTRASKTPHIINLLFDDINSNSDTLKFTLFHNGNGETLEDEGAKDIEVDNSYVSFPINDLIPADKDNIVVAIDWKWHRMIGNNLNPEIENYHTTGIISRKK